MSLRRLRTKLKHGVIENVFFEMLTLEDFGNLTYSRQNLDYTYNHI